MRLVTEPDVRHLHGRRRATDQHDVVAPVELERLSRREGERHIGFRARRRVPLCPDPGIAAHRIVAALVAKRPQLLEDPDQREALPRRLRRVAGEHCLEIGLPAPELGPRLHLTLVSKRGLARAQHLANRVARDLQVAGDLLDRLALDQMLPPYPADRLHNQHPRRPPAVKTDSATGQD